jgi:hypothetical protein
MVHDPRAHPLCPHCGQEVTIHQRIHPGHCGAQACLEREAVAGARARRERQEQEWQDRVALARERAGDRIAALSPLPEPAIAVVPDGDGPLSPLPPERRAVFEAHLRRVVIEAFAAPEVETAEAQDVPAAPVPPALVAAACGTCRGYCCRLGSGRNAFLTVQTFLRQRRAHPEVDAARTIDLFLSHLPARSVTGSCVYHTDAGCALPRERRDDTCNRFHCTDLHRLGAMPESTGGLAVMLVAAQQGKCPRATLYVPEVGAQSRAPDADGGDPA